MSKRKPYPAYKPSGVAWLGKVPKHWEVKRLKFVAPATNQRLDSKPDDLPYLGLENIESKTGRLLIDTPFENIESAVGVFQRGDVLFGKLRPYLAKATCVDFPGVCTTELLALRPTSQIDAHFLLYQLLADGFIKMVDSFTYGAKMPRASNEQIGNVAIPIPPLAEQRAIAAYLDRETARIDALVAKNQRLIELLQEKRTALISHAVTRGLDANAPLKDSGVAWLGKVPKHWKVEFIKRHFQIDLGKMLDSGKQESEEGEAKPYLRAANIHWGRILLDDVNEMKFSKQQLERYALQSGDLLVTEGGVTVGRSAIWRGELDECYYQNSLNRARTKGKASTEYLYFWMYFLTKNGYIELVAEKATFGHLTKEKLEVLPMTIPSLDEQRAIAAYLDRETAKIDALVGKVRQVIEKLQEYRTALISAAVTGKIDVRDL